MAEYGYSVGKEEVKFDRSSQKMYFEAEKFLTNGEMLAITKILIATRTLPQDKMNQLMHARYFKNSAGLKAHMKKHAAILKPKFDSVYKVLGRRTERLGHRRVDNTQGRIFPLV